MKKIAGIYKITNLINSKIYIGSSSNLKSREYSHFWKLNNNSHSNKHLQSAYNKYGKDNFIFEIIEIIEDDKMLLSREQYYLDKLNTCNISIGYNKSPTAGSNLGYKASNETRLKISMAMTGFKHSEESKLKLSISRKGMIFSDIHKYKLSKARKSRVTKDETRLKISAALKNRIRKPHTEESKLKMSINSLGKAGRKILNIDENIIFNTITEASKHYNIDSSAISKVCRNKKISAGGYRWRYLTDRFGNDII